MQYTRGIPLVALADVDSADVTIGDVVAASQLAAEETGWPETLLPAPRTWRVTAPSGDVRIIWGMPFLEAVTSGPVAAADNNAIVEANISAAGIQSIQHVSGFGWLERIGTLTNDLSPEATEVPDVTIEAGEVVLVGSELVWNDGTRLVREHPAAHLAMTPLRRVRAQASLALAITRMAKRAADARARAGASRRRGRDEGGDGALVVLDADSRRALTPFSRPSTTWLQAFPASDVAGGTIDAFDPAAGVSPDEEALIQAVLARLSGGSGIGIGGRPENASIYVRPALLQSARLAVTDNADDVPDWAAGQHIDDGDAAVTFTGGIPGWVWWACDKDFVPFASGRNQLGFVNREANEVIESVEHVVLSSRASLGGNTAWTVFAVQPWDVAVALTYPDAP